MGRTCSESKKANSLCMWAIRGVAMSGSSGRRSRRRMVHCMPWTAHGLLCDATLSSSSSSRSNFLMSSNDRHFDALWKASPLVSELSLDSQMMLQSFLNWAINNPAQYHFFSVNTGGRTGLKAGGRWLLLGIESRDKIVIELINFGIK